MSTTPDRPDRSVSLPPRPTAAPGAAGVLLASQRATATPPPATPAPEAPAAAAPKVQVSVYVPRELRDRARAALRLAGFHEGTTTLSDLVTGALEREVARLEGAYNAGERLEPDPRPATPGRRAG